MLGWEGLWDIPEHLRQLAQVIRAYQMCQARGGSAAALAEAERAVLQQFTGVRDLLDTRQRNAHDAYRDIRDDDTAKLTGALRSYQVQLEDVPDDITEPRFDGPFADQRLWCETTIAAIEGELRTRGVKVERPQPNPRSGARGQVQASVALIAGMERDCEEDVRQHPQQAELIRTIYRKHIDTLKEQL